MRRDAGNPDRCVPSLLGTGGFPALQAVEGYFGGGRVLSLRPRAGLQTQGQEHTLCPWYALRAHVTKSQMECDFQCVLENALLLEGIFLLPTIGFRFQNAGHSCRLIDSVCRALLSSARSAFKNSKAGVRETAFYLFGLELDFDWNRAMSLCAVGA